MVQRSFAKKLEGQIEEGIKYLGLDKHELARRNFKNVILQVREYRQARKTSDAKLSPHYKKYFQYEQRAAFGVGLAEGLRKMRRPYRALDELAAEAKAFCNAETGLRENGRNTRNHIKMGGSYAKMGFKKEAMRILDCCKNEPIQLCYLHRQIYDIG